MRHNDDIVAKVTNGLRQNCNLGVWDNAFEHAEEDLFSILAEDDPSEVYAHGADWAARWIFAILGMAEAIRSREPADHDPLTCIHGVFDRSPCPDCEAQVTYEKGARVGSTHTGEFGVVKVASRDGRYVPAYWVEWDNGEQGMNYEGDLYPVASLPIGPAPDEDPRT